MRPMFKPFCVALLSLSLVTPAFVPLAQAEVIGTAAALAAEGRAANLDAVRTALDREDVRAQLATLGVDRSELDARLAALTDAELATLAQRMGEEPAGGILAVLGVLLVVLLVLEYTGAIDIFKKVP